MEDKGKETIDIEDSIPKELNLIEEVNEEEENEENEKNDENENEKSKESKKPNFNASKKESKKDPKKNVSFKEDRGPFGVKSKENEQAFSFGGNIEEDFNYLAFLSTMFGLFGLIFKYRILIWQSILIGIISICNMKTRNFDYKQAISTFSVCIMGLVMAYFGPQAALFQ